MADLRLYDASRTPFPRGYTSNFEAIEDAKFYTRHYGRKVIVVTTTSHSGFWLEFQ